MKFVFYGIYFTIFGCVAATQPRSINLVLQTAVEFHKESDIGLLKTAQKYLSKIRNILEHNYGRKRNVLRIGDESVKAADIIGNGIMILRSFNDKKLVKIIKIFHSVTDKLRNEYNETNSYNAVILTLLNKIKYIADIPTLKIRSNLHKVRKIIEHGNHLKKENIFKKINEMNLENDTSELIHSLELFKTNESTSKLRLKKAMKAFLTSLLKGYGKLEKGLKNKLHKLLATIYSDLSLTSHNGVKYVETLTDNVSKESNTTMKYHTQSTKDMTKFRLHKYKQINVKTKINEKETTDTILESKHLNSIKYTLKDKNNLLRNKIKLREFMHKNNLALEGRSKPMQTKPKVHIRQKKYDSNINFGNSKSSETYYGKEIDNYLEIPMNSKEDKSNRDNSVDFSNKIPKPNQKHKKVKQTKESISQEFESNKYLKKNIKKLEEILKPKTSKKDKTDHSKQYLIGKDSLSKNQLRDSLNENVYGNEFSVAFPKKSHTYKKLSKKPRNMKRKLFNNKTLVFKNEKVAYNIRYKTTTQNLIIRESDMKLMSKYKLNNSRDVSKDNKLLKGHLKSGKSKKYYKLSQLSSATKDYIINNKNNQKDISVEVVKESSREDKSNLFKNESKNIKKTVNKRNLKKHFNLSKAPKNIKTDNGFHFSKKHNKTQFNRKQSAIKLKSLQNNWESSKKKLTTKLPNDSNNLKHFQNMSLSMELDNSLLQLVRTLSTEMQNIPHNKQIEGNSIKVNNSEIYESFIKNKSNLLNHHSTIQQVKPAFKRYTSIEDNSVRDATEEIKVSPQKKNALSLSKKSNEKMSKDTNSLSTEYDVDENYKSTENLKSNKLLNFIEIPGASEENNVNHDLNVNVSNVNNNSDHVLKTFKSRRADSTHNGKKSYHNVSRNTKLTFVTLYPKGLEEMTTAYNNVMTLLLNRRSLNDNNMALKTTSKSSTKNLELNNRNKESNLFQDFEETTTRFTTLKKDDFVITNMYTKLKEPDIFESTTKSKDGDGFTYSNKEKEKHSTFSEISTNSSSVKTLQNTKHNSSEIDIEQKHQNRTHSFLKTKCTEIINNEVEFRRIHKISTHFITTPNFNFTSSNVTGDNIKMTTENLTTLSISRVENPSTAITITNISARHSRDPNVPKKEFINPNKLLKLSNANEENEVNFKKRNEVSAKMLEDLQLLFGPRKSSTLNGSLTTEDTFKDLEDAFDLS